MIFKVFNLIFLVLVLVANYLANAIPLNQKTTGELSAEYPNLFVPAGLTFSIWGLIYLLLIVFVIVQFRDSEKIFVQSIGWAFILSSLFNVAWIFAWHYQKMEWSLIFMLGILIALVFINLKLTHTDSIWVRSAFGIYLGWISIATIANVTAALVYYNWSGWGISDQTWTLILLSLGLLLSIFLLLKTQNPFVIAAVVWAYIGIIIKRYTDYPLIAGASIVAIVILLIITFGFWTKRMA